MCVCICICIYIYMYVCVHCVHLLPGRELTRDGRAPHTELLERAGASKLWLVEAAPALAAVVRESQVGDWQGGLRGSTVKGEKGSELRVHPGPLIL